MRKMDHCLLMIKVDLMWVRIFCLNVDILTRAITTMDTKGIMVLVVADILVDIAVINTVGGVVDPEAMAADLAMAAEGRADTLAAEEDTVAAEVVTVAVDREEVILDTEEAAKDILDMSRIIMITTKDTIIIKDT